MSTQPKEQFSPEAISDDAVHDFLAENPDFFERHADLLRSLRLPHDTGGTILDQLKAIGSSCDWSRTRFTLDDEYSTAVRRVFVQLYDEGLIYRGHRVIHWCPRCLTSLSDEEAEAELVLGPIPQLRRRTTGWIHDWFIK